MTALRGQQSRGAELQPSVIAHRDESRRSIEQRPTARDPETRKILTAAWRVLQRSHFRSLKVRQVLAASNTSAGNFYRRFPSKAHLMMALLEDEVRNVDDHLVSSIDATAPAAEQLHAWLSYHIDGLYNHARAQRARLLLDQELTEELPEAMYSLHGIIDRRLAEIIRRGIATGEFRPGDPDDIARLVGYLVHGLVVRAPQGATLPDRRELLTTTHEFVLRALTVS